VAVIVKDKSFYKNLLTLALPIMLQNLITFGINFTDNLMVGQLGEAAISGVYLGGQIQAYLTMLIMGISGVVAVLGSQYWGKKDIDSIKIIIAIGARFSLALGVIFCLGSFFFPGYIIRFFTADPVILEEGTAYLKWLAFSLLCFCVAQIFIASFQCVESVFIGFISNLILFVTNIIFNWIFIFGKLGAPALGVRGAALATVICRIIGVIVILVYLLFTDKKLRFRVSDFFLNNKLLFRDCLHYGLPLIAGQAVWSVNMACQSAIIGRLPPAVVAAVSVSNMLFNLIYISSNGLSQAVSVVTGKTIGAGQFELMKLYAKTIQLLFLGCGLLCGFFIFILKTPFIGLYSLEEETIAFSRQFMNILAVTIVGTSYQAVCLAGLVKAGGDVGFVFKMDMVFVFLVVLPSASIALFIFHAAPWVVFACLKCDQILKCAVAVVKINSFNWMKNLTRNF
jgi:putative MATE family efflux protein